MKKILLLVFCVSIMFGAAIVSDSLSLGVFANTGVENVSYPYKNMKSDDVLKLIQKIGKNLIDSNDIKKDISFQLVTSKEQNANTDIDNVITVYRGLVDSCSSTDELASVLAHELAHVYNNHVKKAIGAKLTGMATVKTAEQASYIAAGYTPFSGLAYNGVKLANNLVQNKYSKSQEFTADCVGIDFMVKAGYDPNASISVMKRLGENYNDLFEDHPSSDRRIKHMTDYINQNYPDCMK